MGVMNAIRSRLYKSFLRGLFANWHKMSVQERRKRAKTMDLLTPVSRAISVQPVDGFEIPTMRIASNLTTRGIVLYLHGGAYVLGMTNNHLNLCGKIASSACVEIFAPQYRLAPEHPFHSALQDVLLVYRTLLTSRVNGPAPLFIGGDSAGGGLALALLQEIRRNQLKMPDGVFLFSPWTDLTLSGNSIKENTTKDPVLTGESLRMDAIAYAGGYPLTDPLISPLFCSAQGFPPLLIQVGTEEILLDDARSFARSAEAQGVRVTLEIWENMFHVFQMFPMLPDADRALASIVDFLTSYLSLDSDEDVVQSRKKESTQ